MSPPNEGAFTYTDTLSFTVLIQNGHAENQIQYGLHHRDARHYLNSKDSVFISTMAGRDVYPTIDLLKTALINLPKLTFACFPTPQVGSEGDVANTRVFIVTRGVLAAVDISKWIWKCLEMITEVVDLPGYERHAPTVEGYGCVSVCLGCFKDKLVLRIGLKDPSTREYHQDFAWVINKDVYYDDSYRDKRDEVTLWLYPGGNTWGPVHGGECEVEKKWCVDQIARLIAGGIKHIRSGDLNRFGITMGFGQWAEKQRFLALFGSKDLPDVIPFHTTYFERSMDARGEDHPDDIRPAGNPPESIPRRSDEYRPRYRSRSRRREDDTGVGNDIKVLDSAKGVAAAIDAESILEMAPGRRVVGGIEAGAGGGIKALTDIGGEASKRGVGGVENSVKARRMVGTKVETVGNDTPAGAVNDISMAIHVVELGRASQGKII